MQRNCLQKAVTFNAEFTMVSSGVRLTVDADTSCWVATLCMAIALTVLVTVGEVEEARSALVTLQANHIVFAFALTIIVANG